MAAATPFRFRPARLRFAAPHPFFEDGDVQRHLRLRALRDALEELRPQAPPRAPPRGVCCQEPGCALSFASLGAYEQHYQARHRLSCAACGRALPSAHLLGLHLLERHRRPLLALAARSGPAFQCLLESCPERFRSCVARKAHLLSAHRFPPDFPFDGPAETPQSGAEPGRSLPSEGAVHTEASDRGPAVAMETSCAENTAEDPGQPALGGASSALPASQRWLYKARIPPTICFGEEAPHGFRGQNKDT